MKKVIFILVNLAFCGLAKAQIPVTDVANLANARLAHYENMVKWVDSITLLKTQIEHLKQQVSLQTDIRNWTGDPLVAARKIALQRLGANELIQTYGRARNDLVATVKSLDSLKSSAGGIYRTVEDLDIDGKAVVRDVLTHRRYSVLQAQQENYQQVADETKEREIELQEDLAQTLSDLKEASTDAEVAKQSAKINVLNGQLGSVSAQRRDQMDQVVTQKIANDARAEQERIAAAELEAKDDYLANQRISSFLSTIKVRKDLP